MTRHRHSGSQAQLPLAPTPKAKKAKAKVKAVSSTSTSPSPSRIVKLTAGLVRATPCLSIRQPWAELIVSGERTIETRSWNTNHRGTILVHAAQKIDWPGDKDWDRKDIEALIPGGPSSLKTGGLVGMVDITNVVTDVYDLEDSDQQWWAGEQFVAAHGQPPGMHYWMLANARRVEFAAVPGKVGFFRVDPAIL